MKVIKNGKTLFHLQSTDIGDSVFDMFVFATNTPIKSEIVELLKQEFDDSPDYDYENMADTFEVYMVYSEEI